MSIIANICLSITALIFVVMVKDVHLKTGPRGGDAAMGHAWGVLILNLAFFIFVALSAAAIGWRGGFEWVAAGSGARFVLVALGVLAIVFASGLSSFGPGPGSKMMKPAASMLAFVVPMAVIVSGFLLANDKLEGGTPTPTARWFALMAFWPSVVMVGIFVLAMMSRRVQNIYGRLANRGKLDSFQEGILVNIDACDISKNMVFMLVHTDVHRHPIIRERALAKIKTRPDWQQELVRLLECDWAPEAFTYLGSNEVEDKAMFAEPLRQGVLNQARLIRENIRECSQQHHLYKGKFYLEIERLLRAVEKFEGNGTDYLPAVRELRAALDERWRFEKPKFSSIPMLDKWIKKRQ